MDPYTADQIEKPDKRGFHALLRFLRVVNRHRLILVGFVVATAFLAVVRHQRLPKVYESTARLMVRQTNIDPSTHSASMSREVLTTYRQFLLSDGVLISTVDTLTEKPPELKGYPDRNQWPYVLRENMLDVSFSDEDNVVTVKCRSQDPESTATVIRSLANASSRFMRNDQQEEMKETAKNLETKAEEVQERFFKLQQDQLKARKACGDLAINERSEASHPLVQRVSRLNDSLTTVRSRRIELDAMLKSAQHHVSTGADLTASLQKLESIVGANAIARVPGTTGNKPQLVAKLEDELAQKFARHQGLRQHFGSGHSEIQRLETEIRVHRLRVDAAKQDLQRQVSVGLRSPEIGQWLLNTISAELSASQQYEMSLDEEYQESLKAAQSLSDTLAGIQTADRELDTLRELHSSLLTRLNSINVQPGSGESRPTVLTEPLVPERPVSPVLTQAIAGFCTIGIVLALGIIYIIDLLDDRLRSPEEVRDELGLPVLGIIRKLPTEEVEAATIYVHGFPQTPHAECFRTLKTAITLSQGETKCLAVTSTEASEGKTTTTVNLAASFAQTGVRTLLIDADMRRPGLSRLLDVRGNGGLSEVLRADSGIPELCQERVVSTEVPLLDILPCGPRILNAGMLLSMPSLADVLDWAVSEYDQVIVDCPPTLPVSDAAIVGRYVDGMLFLMNPDKTHRRSVARAVDQLRAMDLRIVGIVANTSLSEEKNSYGYQYGYGYGYGSNYGYGHDEELEDDDQVDTQETDHSFGRAA